MTFNPQPKSKVNFLRRKPKQGQLSKITQKVRNEVLERSEGKCERCGRSRSYAFEMSHLIQASQNGRGDDPANIV
ncbi:HNH endonuclease, partial [Salmonella enterica]|uniref:HNH endonuclease n=1 Tax=Salmonella enterica TaxID=28901 RepID=UPI001BB0D2EA